MVSTGLTILLFWLSKIPTASNLALAAPCLPGDEVVKLVILDASPPNTIYLPTFNVLISTTFVYINFTH